MRPPKATFQRGREHTTTNFQSSTLNLDKILKSSTPGEIAYIWEIEWVQINGIKFERTQILFIATFSLLPSSLLLNKPLIISDRSTWPVWEFLGQKSGHSSRTLSFDRLLFWALNWLIKYWCHRLWGHETLIHLFSLSQILCHFCYSNLSVFVQYKNQYASGLQISIDDVNASNVFTRISAAPD